MRYTEPQLEAALDADQSMALDLLELGPAGYNTYEQVRDVLYYLIRQEGIHLPIKSIQFIFCMPHPKMYVFRNEQWHQMHGG